MLTVYAYCGNTGTSGSPRFITHGSDGATTTAKNTMKSVFPPKNRPYGKINRGTTIPYGTLAGASQELIKVYYYHGYKEDSMLPEFPCLPYEEEPTIDPDEELCKAQLAEHVRDMLDTLTPRESKVLRMRFGIELDCDYTLEEVGNRFQVTRERIRQIEAKALRKMKRPERSEILRQIWMPEDYYKTTEDKKRELRSIQKRWKEAREEREKEIEKEIQTKAFIAGAFLTPKKRKLWWELRPALQDAPWVENLKIDKPEMYQELKELVADIWEMDAKEIWKKYTKEDL
jgi:RNA polymerase sigma factor (sigma-70 family)